MGTAGVDYKLKNIVLGGKSIKIQIWDTAGQERYRNLTKSYFKGAAGIILVYDVCDKASFQNMDYWLQKIKNNADDEHVELLLLGNKIDLINDRVVLEEDIKSMSHAHNNVPHFETSAKDSVNVDKAFKQLISNILVNEHLQEKITTVQSPSTATSTLMSNPSGASAVKLIRTTSGSGGGEDSGFCTTM